MKTQYKTYIIRYDGKIEIEPDKVAKYMIDGISLDNIVVTHSNFDVDEYNKRNDIKIQTADEEVMLDLEWNIPEYYKSLDIDNYVLEYLVSKIPHNEIDVGVLRLVNELEQVKKRNLYDFLRTIIFIIDKFKEKNVVWGVGRGSSCASYILYLMDVHLVNPLKYNIRLEEFFHD